MDAATSENTEADRRYRCLVLLNRTDRPGVFTFHCPRCSMPVAELVNTEISALTDTMEVDNGHLLGVGVRCDGRFQGKGCRIWWYFSLNDAKSQQTPLEHGMMP
jgi:hypothetical protein